VQVGGIYTPPALRGRGLARAAVALHLAEARNTGVSRAVLFAASPAAARAYTAIGFQPNGSFALVLFAAPVTIAA
jgi:predicted GNAT family acetyltransferase